MSNLLIIIGFGGHAKVAANIAKLCGYQPHHLDDDEKHKEYVLGTTEMIGKFYASDTCYFCAIGDNKIRRKIMEENNVKWINLIHPSAQVSEFRAQMGVGNMICAGSVIEPETFIGNGNIFNTNSSVNHDCVINDFNHIGPGTNICGGVVMGDENLFGVGSSVIPNVIIGSRNLFGAGSVIVHDMYTNDGKFLGVPARPMS